MQNIRKTFYNIMTLFRYRKTNSIISITALVFIGSIWFHFLALIDYEYHQDINATVVANTNLLYALNETIRRNFENIDETLVDVKTEYEKNGYLTSEMLSNIHYLHTLPIEHLSVTDANGIIIGSSEPALLQENRNFREYFKKQQAENSRELYLSNVVRRKLSQGEGDWTFHFSRRLNNPDGSFNGVVVAAFKTSYMENVFNKMKLGTSYSVLLQGLDGIVLARQTIDGFSAGMDTSKAEIFSHLKNSSNGTYIAVSSIDKTKRIICYMTMEDYPVAIVISVSEEEALAPFYQRRKQYYWSAAVVSMFFAGACWLLILILVKLRRTNEQLELRVAERTQQIQSINDKLAKSNAELEQFAYVASHDLQEPLRMVSSYVQLLARRYKGKMDADADEFIGFAVDGANRMQHLINDLLLYSRVSSRKREFELTDCNTTVKKVLSDLQLAIEDNQAEIHASNLPAVVVDPTQLGLVFQNLIGNALKYRGSEPPCIEIAAKKVASEWVFTVKDNGIGIDPEYFDRIFVMFQRLHNRAEYPGTGLGLALCKKIIEQHGGRIWVESTYGKESTFFFSIPIKGVKS